ncbi:hypothetical protein V8F20_010217 [Naviculisporaceae sp. PSN 640]
MTGMISLTPATSTASTTLSSSATAPVLAFTTPFVQPDGCSSLFKKVVSTYPNQRDPHITYILPNETNPLYTACLAPAGPRQFSFSPAVCPESWVAYNLGETLAETASGTAGLTSISTAFCCAPGYEFLRYATQVKASPSCQRDLTNGGDGTGTAPALSFARLPAWHISWQTTDVPTLSPQPPAIEGDRITRWVPGSDNPEREIRETSLNISHAELYFAMIGIPFLAVGFIAAYLIPCCLGRARARRERRARQYRETIVLVES